MHQNVNKSVEVVPDSLVFFGALTNCPASYADCATELDGELAELDDVAQTAERESNFHRVGASTRSVNSICIVDFGDARQAGRHHDSISLALSNARQIIGFEARPVI